MTAYALALTLRGMDTHTSPDMSAHTCDDTAYQAAAMPDECTCGGAAWTPERGWHNVSELERRAMQSDMIRRMTGREPRTWVERAQAGQLVRKDMTGAVIA